VSGVLMEKSLVFTRFPARVDSRESQAEMTSREFETYTYGRKMTGGRTGGRSEVITVVIDIRRLGRKLGFFS
jgi:hypothetical protein